MLFWFFRVRVGVRIRDWRFIIVEGEVGEGVKFGIEEGLDEEVARGGGDAGDEGLRGAEEGVAAGEGAEVGDRGERGVEVEAVDVDELAELEAVGEDEVGVGVGEEDVGGVEGVGEV